MNGGSLLRSNEEKLEFVEWEMKASVLIYLPTIWTKAMTVSVFKFIPFVRPPIPLLWVIAEPFVKFITYVFHRQCDYGIVTVQKMRMQGLQSWAGLADTLGK